MSQIQKWQDSVTGTCYANTMQWALYDPVTKKVSQPDSNIAGHRSYNPPTWPVAPPEKEYCAQLAKWWAAVQRTRAERQGTAVQIGGGPIITAEKKQCHRQHLLISEADPGREPRGYFNCTIEVRVLRTLCKNWQFDWRRFYTGTQTTSPTFTASMSLITHPKQARTWNIAVSGVLRPSPTVCCASRCGVTRPLRWLCK